MKPFFNLLSEIVTALEKFVSTTSKKGTSLEAFILWLNREVLFKKEVASYHYLPEIEEIAATEKKSGATSGEKEHSTPANVHLTLLIHALSKHFKLYSRKVLFDTDLVSMDGHTFLATLCDVKSMRKIELIRANFLETPSGIEVIKRLLRKGFIEEFDDPDDKRAKRVRVSTKGRQAYAASLAPLRKVINVMSGRLAEDKKIQLISLLDELNGFHAQLHHDSKGLSLDELMERCK